jgi:hypothetical protein
LKIYVNPALRALIGKVCGDGPLADSCLVFASQLYLKGAERRDFDHFFPLHSRLSRLVYTTRFYGPMLTFLREHNAIEMKGGGAYQRGVVSKRYRLARRYSRGVAADTLDSPKLEARLQKMMDRSSYKVMSGTARKWILKTYQSVSFTPATAEMVARHPFKSEPARHCVEHHIENVVAGRLRFKVCAGSGRVYYPIANLPKAIRGELLLDGEEVVEIDIAASQPTLLATLYPEPCPERDRYLSFVQGGRFYENIAEWAGKKWTRDEAKTEFFNQIAFGSYYCAASYDLLVPFTKRFPQLAGQMAAIKKLGNTALPLRMQKLEATIAVDGTCGECAREGIPVLPVHDSLICKKTDSARVEEIFARHWFATTMIPASLKVNCRARHQSITTAVEPLDRVAPLVDQSPVL